VGFNSPIQSYIDIIKPQKGNALGAEIKFLYLKLNIGIKRKENAGNSKDFIKNKKIPCIAIRKNSLRALFLVSLAYLYLSRGS
jgi:hypothetical protein